MDTDELDYLEKRGLASPAAHLNHARSADRRPRQLQEGYQYHSQLTGAGVFGISAYGLIVLSFLLFAGLMFFGVVHGFWHLVTHWSTQAAAAKTGRRLD